MSYQYKSDDDRLWTELFKIALGGCSAVGGLITEPDVWMVVERAALIADRALVRIVPRLAEPIRPDASAELFGPMLKAREVQQQKDEDDSGFAVAR